MNEDFKEIELLNDNSLENYAQNNIEEDVNEELISDNREIPDFNSIEYLESIYDLNHRRKVFKKINKSNEYDESLIENPTHEFLLMIHEYQKRKEKKNILKMVTRKKVITDEYLDSISDDEYNELFKKYLTISKFYRYNPKKNFDSKYKNKRKNRNSMAKKSRSINRKYC